MSTRINLKDVGWMCHVIPLKKKEVYQVPPPISQIPGIGFMSEESDAQKKHTMYFRSTDSPFVRLSKMGGRPDLLCFRENEHNSGAPVPYYRCEWYYLEDNALELKQNVEPEHKQYVFKVPFYMSDSSAYQTEKSMTTKETANHQPPEENQNLLETTAT
ncbi:unnamed protein product [Schistosoma turkestanicum]|nr:unnamed protein product [Schistosoma turkestanicum]